MADGAGGFGAGGAATPGSAQDFVVNVGDRVFFETDQTDLTPTAVATLDKQAQWLLPLSATTPSSSKAMRTSAAPASTTSRSRARRAQIVRDYLISRGIQGNRFRTVSYGKERPVAVCNDISCWSQNRRAVTVLGGGAGA